MTLNAIAGSPTDMWAAGSMLNNGRTLAVHGDRKTWQVVPGLPTALLPGLAVDQENRPWLIENFRDPKAALTTRTAQRWADTPLPNPKGTVGLSLHSITAVPGTGKLIAVGDADLPTNPRTVTAVIFEFS